MTPVEFASGIEGWMMPDELQFLSRTAAALQPGAVWAEIGTWFGKSWSCVALSLPVNSTIIAVDTWMGEADEPLAWVQGHGSAMQYFSQTYEKVKALRPDLTMPIIEMLSVPAASQVRDGFCDVVFIDANHRTEHVKADREAWAPKLKPGGLMCGHDGNDQRVIAALEGLSYSVNPSERGSIWCLT